MSKELKERIKKSLTNKGISEEDAESFTKEMFENVGVDDEYLAKITENTPKFLEKLSNLTKEKAEELTLELPNIAPMGDYSKLIEDNDGMAEFLKSEAHKPEHWKLTQIRTNPVNETLTDLVFNNTSVGDGTDITGCVFINKDCVIRHAIVVYND